MSNAATIDNITAIDSKKRSTKQELIAANIKLLIEQLEAGKSDALTNYLTAMSRFHNYSFGNVLEIARQMPTATRVAGFWTWKNLGRSVNAGAKGIRILAPIVGVRRKKDKEAEKDITKQNERILLGFRNAYVFDISQTNGVDLPAMHEVGGDPGENIDRLAAFLKSKRIQLVYNQKIAPALGVSYGGRIAILPGQSKAEEFSTLVHETAHEMLHKADRRTATTKTVRELEAEAVAFVVGKAVGLVNGNASADYIQLYQGNASLLAESLEVIQQTSAVILTALEPPTEEQAAMPDAELGEGGVMKTILDILRKAGGWRPSLYVKIENPPYMELVIEATDDSGPCGLPCISVAHYGLQNGDLMRDPEMCFELANVEEMQLNPFYWRNDYIAVEQWSRDIHGNQFVYLRELHKQHQQFAEQWDNNLRSQGYAEVFTDKCILG